MTRILKLTAKGLICGAIGVPLGLILALGGTLVGVSLLGIFAVMDLLHVIENDDNQYR